MTLFDEGNQDQNTQVTPDKAFEILTGPGGKYDRTKYKDEAEMYKAMAFGKLEADRTIEIRNRTEDQLREDYKKLREEYNAGPKLQELLDQLKTQREQQTPNTPQGNEQQSVFDETKAMTMVQQALQAAKQEEQAAQNLRMVESKLQEAYGEDYKRHLKQKVSQLGLTEDFVNTLARSHPQVLFKTLELDRQGEGFQSPPSSSRRSDLTNGGPERTWSYYEKLRKEKPEVYHDPKTKAQMAEDYRRLGSKFEDGNWITPRYIH